MTILVFIAVDRVVSLLFGQDKKHTIKNIVKMVMPEKHYDRLESLLKNQQYKGAVKEIEWFRKNEQINYKDVELYMKVIWERLSNRVKKIPVRKTAENNRLYDLLCRLEPNNKHYQKKKEYYQSRLDN